MYTFFLDFRGGTYISQIESDSLNEAIILWGKNLDFSVIKHLGYTGKCEINHLLEEKPEPVGITGLTNVWFISFSTKKGYISMNIVKTQAK